MAVWRFRESAKQREFFYRAQAIVISLCRVRWFCVLICDKRVSIFFREIISGILKKFGFCNIMDIDNDGFLVDRFRFDSGDLIIWAVSRDQGLAGLFRERRSIWNFQ